MPLPPTVIAYDAFAIPFDPATRMLKKLAPLFLSAVAALSTAQPLPAEFVHDRIYLKVPAPDGSMLRLYTDSGGGFNTISKPVADRLKLPVVGKMKDDGTTFSLVNFPAFLHRAGIPRPDDEPTFKGRLVIAPDARLDLADGFLGTRWFAGRIWQIDYPAQKLTLLPTWIPTDDDHAAPLGFHHGADGKRDFNFPRIEITVDARPIDVLLDTGATARLTETSSAQFALQPGTLIAASYIVKSIFDNWHANHPDWKVVADGEAGTGHAFSMIEVPKVTIAGVAFGPVWFSQRPDQNFRQGMAPMMDKPIDGAIGGSGLKYLRVVLDYPGGKAYVRAATPAASVPSP